MANYSFFSGFFLVLVHRYYITGYTRRYLDTPLNARCALSVIGYTFHRMQLGTGQQEISPDPLSTALLNPFTLLLQQTPICYYTKHNFSTAICLSRSVKLSVDKQEFSCIIIFRLQIGIGKNSVTETNLSNSRTVLKSFSHRFPANVPDHR